MINNKKVLAIIPARGGSKGVPRKNIRDLAGKPLIAWTIEEAKKSKYIDRLILSSEDEEIISVAKAYGCEVPFVRPEELASDNTPGIDPILHALQELDGYDYVILLQPTSPLRTVEDIDKCIRQTIELEAPACVSVVKAKTSPHWMYEIGEGQRLVPSMPQRKEISRRQDLPPVYLLNGAVYVASVKWLQQTKSFLTKRTVAYEMPKNRSYDIDSENDFRQCVFLMKKKTNFTGMTPSSIQAQKTYDWLSRRWKTNAQSVKKAMKTEVAARFLVTWSIFETELFGSFLRKNDIRKFSDKHAYLMNRDTQLYDYFCYFHERYQNQHNKNNLIHDNNCVEFENITEKGMSEIAIEDQLYLLLYVVYRYRNNIFHGNKPVYNWLEFEFQIEKCIEIMMIICDEKIRLY